jgi:biotin/methionine sulfoxide reductase
MQESAMDRKLVRHHSHWGAFNAVVEDGKVIGTLPFDFDPDPSPLIEAIPDALHSWTRVARPMVRAGWLENRPANRAGRGREPFVPVEWEETLRLVAGELARVRGEHGPVARDYGTSRLSQGPSSATALVEIEKWTNPPPVRAFGPAPRRAGAGRGADVGG